MDLCRTLGSYVPAVWTFSATGIVTGSDLNVPHPKNRYK